MSFISIYFKRLFHWKLNKRLLGIGLSFVFGLVVNLIFFEDANYWGMLVLSFIHIFFLYKVFSSSIVAAYLFRLKISDVFREVTIKEITSVPNREQLHMLKWFLPTLIVSSALVFVSFLFSGLLFELIGLIDLESIDGNFENPLKFWTN